MCRVTSSNTEMSKPNENTAQKDNTVNVSKMQLPLLAKIWTDIYNMVPKVYFPRSDIDISFCLITIPVLYLARNAIENILINVFDWPDAASDEQGGMDKTKEAVGALTAMVHSTTLVPALYTALFQCVKYCPSERLKCSQVRAPQYYIDLVSALLQFCTGYMIYDCIFGVLLLRWDDETNQFNLKSQDKLYLAHHVTTVFYMTSTRIVNAGHQSAMMCMFLGEFTNPVFNTYGILQVSNTLKCCSGGLFSYYCNQFINVAFPTLFILFRAVLAPIFCTHMAYDLLLTKKANINIPIALRILWVIMQWGVILGSIPWVTGCWDILKTNFSALSTIATSVEL